MSSRKRTCLIFHSSSSLNSHPVREVFSQHQKDPEKKLVELGTFFQLLCSLQYTKNRIDCSLWAGGGFEKYTFLLNVRIL